MTDPTLRVLIPSEKIQARIKELGEQISRDYPEGRLHMIAILKGAAFFLADLTRAIEARRVHRLHGYFQLRKRETSSGEVKVTKDLDISLEGAEVLIVEDIVDSGITPQLPDARAGPAEAAFYTDRGAAGQARAGLRPVHVSYVGFQIPDQFVVGYGLDFDEKYRNLDDICVLERGADGGGIARGPGMPRLGVLAG